MRGFMAGALKRAGYQVESFKPEGGERSYASASSPNISLPGPPGCGGHLCIWASFPARTPPVTALVLHAKSSPSERPWAKRDATVAQQSSGPNPSRSPRWNQPAFAVSALFFSRCRALLSYSEFPTRSAGNARAAAPGSSVCLLREV